MGKGPRNEVAFLYEKRIFPLNVACERSRLSFTPATACETRRERVSLRVSHVVVGVNEKRLYSQASLDELGQTFVVRLVMLL